MSAQPEQQSSPAAKSMDDIMALCKRRGFVYPASEIYGGINGFWDYGPLGAMLKKNLRDAWWHDMVMTGCRGATGPDGKPVRIVPVDTCIIQNPKVWQASGHVAGFSDPMVDDKETKQRFRADQLVLIIPLGEDHAHVWLSPNMPAPVATIVASSAHEAKMQAYSNPKSLRIAPDAKAIKSLGFIDIEHEPQSWRETALQVEYRDGSRGYLWFAPASTELLTTLIDRRGDVMPSPFTGHTGVLTSPRAFNLMFKTYIGATATEDDVAYLRPETAQGIFVQFKNVVDTTRVRLPFGIAQVGKAFRNEITPRNFTYRSREFEQMEIEFFCHPDDKRAWYEFWRDQRMKWWESVGLAGENLQLREHGQDELSHYSSATSDVEYRFPFTAPGFGELEGIADRGCFDLTQHQEHSGVKLDYFDTERGEIGPNGQPKGERYIPHVIEPSGGQDRGVLAVLCEAYTRDESRASPEIMRIHPRLAPIKAAVFPLVKKDGMPEIAERIRRELVARFGGLGLIEYDEKQSIGKRYARMDEAGCPWCFTVDGQTKEDGTVTVRDRDTGSQERINAEKVVEYVGERLG